LSRSPRKKAPSDETATDCRRTDANKEKRKEPKLSDRINFGVIRSFRTVDNVHSLANLKVRWRRIDIGLDLMGEPIGSLECEDGTICIRLVLITVDKKNLGDRPGGGFRAVDEKPILDCESDPQNEHYCTCRQ
jgi:hypothetical protein